MLNYILYTQTSKYQNLPTLATEEYQSLNGCQGTVASCHCSGPQETNIPTLWCNLSPVKRDHFQRSCRDNMK